MEAKSKYEFKKQLDNFMEEKPINPFIKLVIWLSGHWLLQAGKVTEGYLFPRHMLLAIARDKKVDQKYFWPD